MAHPDGDGKLGISKGKGVKHFKLLGFMMAVSIILLIATISIINGQTNKNGILLVTQSETAGRNSAKNKDLRILKSEVTNIAKFYPYTADGVKMEVIAVKATDGTIRTALNTCQVCYDSGRGFYTQTGDVLICNNCGNRFKIDQIEKQKYGCNPIPIFQENKTDDGKYITISKDFLVQSKGYFLNWKKY